MDNHQPATWRPDVRLPGATIRIADVTGTLSAHARWKATLDAHIYLLLGTGTTPDTHTRVTGYLGITEAHTSGRPWVSLTRWVRNAAALDLDTIALVTFDDQEPDLDVLRVLEASMIRHLNRNTHLLNTVTAAPTSSQALGPAADTHAAHGLFLATVLRHHALRGRANPLLSPASTLRETAIRVVLAADRALDTADVLTRVNALLGDASYHGLSVGSTLRRDLTVREAGINAGQPRVRSVHVAGRCLYYPAHLPSAVAIERYLAHRQRHAA